MRKRSKAKVVLTLLVLLSTACGDDGGGGEGDGDEGGDGDGASGSALQEKLADCPLVNQSSDPAASACLQGTYSGKTLAGDTCTLNVGAGNAFSFESPTLSVNYTPPSDVILLFGHMSVSDFHQLIWKVGDPISTDPFYDLDFQARFGSSVPEADVKIEIELIKHLESGDVAVTCIVPL